MAPKLQKTPADYVAIAVSPVLIMVLVGTLAFFLLEVLYSGGFVNRFRWILFWFVLASVLVARIGIEQGKEHAAAYGLALGAATALVSARFVDSILTAWVLLGVIWWCANKLTWDCTLIDDHQDASGEGLLQIAGMDEEGESDSAKETPDPAGKQPEEKPTRPPLWQRLFLNASERADKPHAPGLWVVYFSLAALPLFGVGQLFIAERSRQFGFQLLWLYVAAGLGLLLTTSFLGIRRYLRQRRLQMPAAMTGSWIGMGTGLIVVILLICLVLPRPDGTLAALTDRIDTFSRDASRFALLKRDAGEGDGDNRGRDEDADPDGGAGNSQKKSNTSRPDDRQAAQAQGDADSGNTQAQSDSDAQSGGQGENSGKGQGDQQGDQRGQNSAANSDQPGDSGEQAEQSEDGEQRGNEGGQQQPPDRASAPRKTPPIDPTTSVKTLANLIKWAIYGAILLALLFVVVRNWSLISAAVARFIQEWLSFWGNLFGGRSKRSGESGEAAAEAALAPPPFESFRNPFSSGMADRTSAAQLVRYTFDALQAWAIERNAGRRPDQTPIEFAQSLQPAFADLGREAVLLARLYAGLAYADKAPPDDCRKALERLWRELTPI